MKKYLFTVRNLGAREHHVIATIEESESYDHAINNGEVQVIEETEEKITFIHNGVNKSLSK